VIRRGRIATIERVEELSEQARHLTWPTTRRKRRVVSRNHDFSRWICCGLPALGGFGGIACSRPG
jgi:hypothetical protein